MPPIQTVLFDLDGTLIDSIRLILDSYHHTLAVHGFPPRTEAEWLLGIGIPLRVQLGHFARSPEELDALIATYRAFNLAHHDEMVTAYPGVVDMVRAVRAGGHRTGVVTSKNHQGALLGLRHIGLTDAMDVVIGADDVENPKPHREPVDKAVALLGADPGTTIYVGDSIHDMHCGRAAGVRTGAALWGPFGRADLAATEPDFWLETPADLLPILT
jgi:pyrophosphatase PpaX